MEPEDWQSVMNVNFGGIFNCTKAALRHLMRERDGSIVNISSVMGQRGWVGQANYSASKGAVNAFTRCARWSSPASASASTPSCRASSPTELVEGLTEKDGGKGILKQLPMGKFGEVEDIARPRHLPRRPGLEVHDRRASPWTAGPARCSARARYPLLRHLPDNRERH